MTNKSFMIFQTAVRKYVGIHEKSKSGYFVGFNPQIKKNDKKKFRTKYAENFLYALYFFEVFTNSEIKIRTSIFSKLNKE